MSCACLIREQATGSFGLVFGGDRGRSIAHRLTAPICPKTGSRELAALKRPHAGGAATWNVGWYGSPWSFALMPGLEDRQALWQEHHRFVHVGVRRGEVQLLQLSHGDPYPHLRLSFEQLPVDIQERIVHEVALGVHRLAGSTNDRPLNPF